METIATVKLCTKCKKELPTTSEFFHKKKDGRFGLQSWCKGCRKTYQQLDRCKELSKKTLKKYRKSDKGKQVQATFWRSEKGKKIQRKYLESVKGKETQKRKFKKYNCSRKGRNRDKRAYEKNKLSCCISARIRQSIKGSKANKHWGFLVDYSLESLKQHLESLFKSGMSWDNYGEWHIDHKIPISTFNITSYRCEDFKKCWALENLQPLWAEENWKKNNKIGENSSFHKET